MKFMKKSLLALLALTLVFGCKKDETDQQETDRKIILDYIDTHNLDAKGTESGLYYVVETEGTGKRPSFNSDVTVVYRGYLTNGVEFDASNADGLTLNLGQVIPGWQEGLQLFRQGGKGMLLIPSHLGYGRQGKGSIPSNAVLIFEIELTRVF